MFIKYFKASYAVNTFYAQTKSTDVLYYSVKVVQQIEQQNRNFQKCF